MTGKSCEIYYLVIGLHQYYGWQCKILCLLVGHFCACSYVDENNEKDPDFYWIATKQSRLAVLYARLLHTSLRSGCLIVSLACEESLKMYFLYVLAKTFIDNKRWHIFFKNSNDFLKANKITVAVFCVFWICYKCGVVLISFYQRICGKRLSEFIELLELFQTMCQSQSGHAWWQNVPTGPFHQ